MRTIHKFSPGEIFNNRYKLLSMIGAGGFAEVWKAKDTFTNSEIAIKVYAKLDKEGRSQLTEEYARVQSLSHPNILKAEHFDICDNRPYLTMRYCSGGSLAAQFGHLSATDMMWVVRDIMSALAYLHANGIVHQDIKPANILIDTEGKRPRYVLCDFGISSRTRTSMSKSVNHLKQDTLFMTTFYAPPEKFSSRKAERQPFAEGDIFSLGITLLELTGALNDMEQSLGAEMMNNSQPEINYSILPSEPLQYMVQRMLQFNRKERGSAQLFYDWAENVINNLSQWEQNDIQDLTLLNDRQRQRLLQVENDRKKSLVYSDRSTTGEYFEPQNRENTQTRKPVKIALPDEPNDDFIDTEQSSEHISIPKPIPVPVPQSTRKRPLFVVSCVLGAILLCGGGYVLYKSLYHQFSTIDKTTYLPDADINYVKMQLPQLEQAMDYIRKYKHTYNDCDLAASEIEICVKKCKKILATPGLETYQRQDIEQKLSRLQTLQQLNDSAVAHYNSTPQP